MDEREDTPNWSIRRVDDVPLVLDASVGRVTVFVGPNGTGKSALAMSLEKQAVSRPVNRVIAHRLLIFEGSGSNLTVTKREQYGTNIKSWNYNEDSRYFDHVMGARPNAVLFDLLSRIHTQNAKFRNGIESGTLTDPSDAEPSTLSQLNDVMASAGLQVQLVLNEVSGFNAVHSGSTVPYGINEMSDGERAALLIAGSVLTAQAGVQILDEPERHLHRAVSSPLLRSLAALRPDCHLVVFTHDLGLASELPDDVTTRVVVRGCQMMPASDRSWDLSVLPDGAEIPEQTRRALMGGRDQVLLIEGTETSLDNSLYPVLYPDWTVSPVSGGCGEVVRAVKGLRSCKDLHWIEAAGLVDRDRRTDDEVAGLERAGIRVLSVSEVENLYYHPETLRLMATVQADHLGGDASRMEAEAIEAALSALDRGDALTRLAAGVAADAARRAALTGIPSPKDLMDGRDVTQTIANTFDEELSRIRALHESGDLCSLVAEFPVRECGLRADVAKVLRFPSIEVYEQAVRAAAARDDDIRKHLRSLASNL